MKNTLTALFCLCAVIAGSGTGYTQQYPDRPIHVIVGVPPGGSLDGLARLIGPKLEERLGRSIVIENVAGADATIGAARVVRSKPDGYTLLFAASNLASAPFTLPVNYDHQKELVPIVVVGTQPGVIVVSKDFAANSLKEFVAYAKSKPGELNFGTGGTATLSYITMVELMKKTGINMVNVSYSGGGPMMIGLLSREVQVLRKSPTQIVGPLEAGKIKALAVTSKDRSPALPGVPTVAAELNLPDFDAGDWDGLLAPAGTPREIIARLNAEVNAMIKAPDMAKTLISRGFNIIGGSPESFGTLIKKDTESFRTILQAAPK